MCRALSKSCGDRSEKISSKISGGARFAAEGDARLDIDARVCRFTGRYPASVLEVDIDAVGFL